MLTFSSCHFKTLEVSFFNLKKKRVKQKRILGHRPKDYAASNHTSTFESRGLFFH